MAKEERLVVERRWERVVRASVFEEEATNLRMRRSFVEGSFGSSDESSR